MTPGPPPAREATTAELQRLRPHLQGVADSHPGSLAEAEDVVHEARLRLARRGDSLAAAQIR